MSFQVKAMSPDSIQTINNLINVDQSLVNDDVKYSETIIRLNKKINLLKDNLRISLPNQFSKLDQNEFFCFCSRINSLSNKLQSLKEREENIRYSIKNFNKSIEAKENDKNKNELLEQLITRSVSLKRQNDYFSILINFENYKLDILDKLEIFNSIRNKNLSSELSKNQTSNVEIEMNSSKEQSEISRDLIKKYQRLKEIFQFSTGTKCNNLKSYTIDLLSFVQNLLRESFKQELEKTLNKFNYPKISIDFDRTEKSENLKKNIHDNVFYLLIIDEPFFETKESFQNQNSVIETLIKPFEKRFRFHFFTNRKTNDISKPEWFLSQIMQWIREQHYFLTRFIQPIFDENKYWTKHSALILFLNKLIFLIKDKLEADIKKLSENSEHFLHAIDELLVFSNHLNSFLKTTENETMASNHQAYYTCFHIICENQFIFSHWLNLEKQIWQKYLDEMFSNDYFSLFMNQNIENSLSKNSTGSCERLENNNLNYDVLISTKCAECIVLLIKSIQDRYYNLPFPSKKICFANLQLDLLKEFHLRLCQILRDEANNIFSKTYLGVLNTIIYVIKVLEDWKNSKFYIQLQFYRVKYAQFIEKHQFLKNLKSHNSLNSDNEINTLFDESLEVSKPFLDIEGTIFDDLLPSYEKVKNDIVKQIVHKCKWEFTSRANSYIHEKWMCMPLMSEINKQTLTDSASDMLISLRNMLHLLKDSITQDILNTIIKKLSSELDNFYFKDVILNNKFNEGGIQQLNFDVNKYLMPILNEFSINCNISCFFRLTNESINLLMLKKGSALLLNDLIEKAVDINPSLDLKLNLYNAKNALKELSIHHLTCEQSQKILSLRSDLFY